MELVTDSSIWIDLHHGKMLSAPFRLGFDLIAPDVIVAELLEPKGSYLVTLGLRPRELTGAQVGLADELASRYRRPCRNDIFALALAMSEKLTLLTGDWDLRKAAEAEAVEKHGTLWILDRMVERQAVTAARAAAALEVMVSHGSRLPKHEVESRLRRWKR